MQSIQKKRKHLPVCSEGMRRAAIRRSAFLRFYPDYCRTCSAYGIEWREDYEGMLQDYDCPDCLEKDLCPRCKTLTMVMKQDTLSIEYQTCSKCKWRGDDDYGDKYGLPNKPICVCTVRE